MKKVFAIAILSLFFAGCASNDKVKEDIKEVKEDVKQLEADVDTLAKDAAKAEVEKEDAMEGSQPE